MKHKHTGATVLRWASMLVAVLTLLVGGGLVWAWRGDNSMRHGTVHGMRQDSRPSASNSGVPAGTALAPVSGPVTITRDREVLDGLAISGRVIVEAEGVVIRRSRLIGSTEDEYAVMVNSGSVTVEDSEIVGYQNGIGFDNWVGRRLNIHGFTDDAVKLGSHVRLEDSWIHDIRPGSTSHADGAQMQGGSVDVVVTRNVIDMTSQDGHFGNAAIFLAPDLGPSSDGPVTVANNWLDGGNYILYCVDGANGEYVVAGITLENNRFGRRYRYGPATVTVPVQARGNVFEDTGEPIRMD